MTARRRTRHGRIPQGIMARGERLSARQDGPFRPARRAVPQLGDGERRSGAERRRRVQGRAGPLSPHRLARLPVGAPHPHLPQAQGTREHDLALGRPLAAGRARLDLRRRPRRHSRPDLRRERASRVLCQGAARLQRPRHRAGAVGQEDGHDRQQRIVRNHPHVQSCLRWGRRGGRRLLSERATNRDRRAQRPHLRDRQQRRLSRRLRHHASRLTRRRSGRCSRRSTCSRRGSRASGFCAANG